MYTMYIVGIREYSDTLLASDTNNGVRSVDCSTEVVLVHSLDKEHLVEANQPAQRLGLASPDGEDYAFTVNVGAPIQYPVSGGHWSANAPVVTQPISATHRSVERNQI